jgi:hypothetical protein
VLFNIQGAIGTEVHALATQITLERRFLIWMGEHHVLGANFDALQATDAVITVNVVGPLLILEYALYRADLRTLSALRAGPHLEHSWIGELGING